MRTNILFATLVILFGCGGKFDDKVAEADLKKFFPQAEIIKLNSYDCDGTMGECFYVHIVYKTSESGKLIDTTWQYWHKESWMLKLTENPQLSEDRGKLKRLAFCTCMYMSNPQSDFWKNEGSADGYNQTGNFSLEAIEPMSFLAEKFSKKRYGSYQNRDLIIMKCLDFYHSQELDSLVNIWVPE